MVSKYTARCNNKTLLHFSQAKYWNVHKILRINGDYSSKYYPVDVSNENGAYYLWGCVFKCVICEAVSLSVLSVRLCL
jgi:hypothetical protein